MPQVLRARPISPLLSESDDDAGLVAQAKQDRQAFASLYRRYVNAVYRYCDRCLGNREMAEDATSLIFVKALAAISTCHDDAFRSWLFAIAHNVIVDTRRAPAGARPLDEATGIVDWAPERSPEMQALASDEARTIRDLLAQLPSDQRELLELRLAGLTDIEIARIVGRSHGAVRTSQYRAIARLRAIAGVAPVEEAPHDPR